MVTVDQLSLIYVTDVFIVWYLQVFCFYCGRVDIESVNVICVVQGTVKPGSHQFFVYDNVTLQQVASVNDIIVASPDTAYLLTDTAVCISWHFSL